MLSRLLKKGTDTDSESGPAFAARSLFSSERKGFYGRLRRALPKCYIFPNLELSNLMAPTATDARQRRAQYEILAGRKVDFAVFDARLSLLCVIELSRAPSEAADVVTNAGLLATAGIRRFCWDRNNLPSSEQLVRVLTDVSAGLPSIIDRDRMLGMPTVMPTIMAAPERINVGAPKNLTVSTLEELTPHGHLRTGYAHVWQRICMFCHEPEHLAQYLNSLSMQDRGGKRAGFPAPVLIEIADLLRQNQRFVITAPVKPSWNDLFVNR